MRERTAPAALALVAVLMLGVGTAATAAVKVKVGTVQPIAIDGSIADWKDVPLQYFEKGPRVTALAHDGRFLYVHFRFSDLALAKKVLRSGAIVWINGEGDDEASFGLRYRGSPELEQALREQEGPRDEMSAGPPGGGPPGDGSPEGPPVDGASRGDRPRGDPSFGKGRGVARAPLGALEILHLGVVDEVVPGGIRDDGPAAACGMADGAFAFELRVPLAELSAAAQLGGVSPPTRIAIGFQMGGMTPSELKDMRERTGSEGGPAGGGRGGGFGGGPGGGSGGGPSGGFGGGPGGGGPGGGGPPGGGRPQGRDGGMSETEITWVKAELLDLKASTATAR